MLAMCKKKGPELLALSSLNLPRFMLQTKLCPTLQATNRPVKTAGQHGVDRLPLYGAEQTSEHRT